MAVQAARLPAARPSGVFVPPKPKAPQAAPAKAAVSAAIPDWLVLAQEIAAAKAAEQAKPAASRPSSGVGKASPAPAGKAPAAKAPVAKVPMAKAPAAEAPVAKAPVAKAPVAKAPAAKAPLAKAPVVKARVAKAPVAKAPASVASAPAVKAPVAKAPVAKAPVAKVPVVKAPPATAPLAEVPGTSAVPAEDSPETERPTGSSAASKKARWQASKARAALRAKAALAAKARWQAAKAKAAAGGAAWQPKRKALSSWTGGHPKLPRRPRSDAVGPACIPRGRYWAGAHRHHSAGRAAGQEPSWQQHPGAWQESAGPRAGSGNSWEAGPPNGWSRGAGREAWSSSAGPSAEPEPSWDGRSDPSEARDPENRKFDFTKIVINIANVGANYGKTVLKRQDRMFDWDGIRRCAMVLRKRNYQLIAVLHQDYRGTDSNLGGSVLMPKDIRDMMLEVNETPRIAGENHKSADDEMTIKCAYRRNCHYLDNDNYKEWIQQMRDDKVRTWLQRCQPFLQLRYFFDGELGFFDLLDGNMPRRALQSGMALDKQALRHMARD